MMKQAIVIATYRGSPWLDRCINSIPSLYPTIVMRNGPYECAALKGVLRLTSLDRWLFLQDSTMVKDYTWIGEHWAEDTSVGLIGEPSTFGSYLGFWRRSILEQCVIPDAYTKIDAVLAEMSLPQQYTALDPSACTLWPELTIHTAVDELMFAGTPHERVTKRYENEFFVKWKSSTCGGTAESAQKRDDKIRELYP